MAPLLWPLHVSSHLYHALCIQGTCNWRHWPADLWNCVIHKICTNDEGAMAVTSDEKILLRMAKAAAKQIHQADLYAENHPSSDLSRSLSDGTSTRKHALAK